MKFPINFWSTLKCDTSFLKKFLENEMKKKKIRRNTAKASKVFEHLPRLVVMPLNRGYALLCLFAKSPIEPNLLNVNLFTSPGLPKPHCELIGKV